MITQIKGLKFPDESVTRFFFKAGLDQRKPGRVLELGCGNGNNLRLFWEFGWEIVGLDMNPAAISQAQDNFTLLSNQWGKGPVPGFSLIVAEMQAFLSQFKPGVQPPFDIVLLPNCLNYLDSYAAIEQLFAQLRDKCFWHSETSFFIKMRSPQDYRYGRGEKVGPQSWRMITAETNELGCINTFLHEYQLVQLVQRYTPLKNFHVLHCSHDNEQPQQLLTHNADMILWGPYL